jgi:hypothetical protein
VVLGGLLIAGTLIAAAQSTVVHRCVGADGTPRYQDAPCPAGDTADRLELQQPETSAPVAGATPPASTPPRPAPPPARPSRQPPPQLMSWRCEVENGEVYFRHDGCPDSLTEPVAYSGRFGGGFGGFVYLRVRGSAVSRAEACREIRHGVRFGAERDQRASPYEKLSGRDLCG